MTFHLKIVRLVLHNLFHVYLITYIAHNLFLCDPSGIYLSGSIFNRPGVAGAVLQSPPSFINQLILHFFIKKNIYIYINIYYPLKKLDKLVEGLLSTGPTPSRFYCTNKVPKTTINFGTFITGGKPTSWCLLWPTCKPGALCLFRRWIKTRWMYPSD